MDDIKYIAIDPGTSNCGIAIFYLNNKLEIINIITYTITVDRDIPLYKRILIIYNILYKIINDINPIHLVHETAFSNSNRPQAYGPLYTTIYMIRKAYMDIMGEYGLFAYSPKSVKKIISSGDAYKEDMLEGIRNIPILNKYYNTNMSEHEIDAMSIGYMHYLQIKKLPELFLL